MNLSLDFAFEGFRLIRQKPRLILFWGLLTLIGNSLIAIITTIMAGPALAELSHVAAQSPDPQTTLALMTQIAPALAAGMPIYILTSAVMTAAICRAVLSEADERFGFLRFGKHEVLLIALEIVMLFVRVIAMAGFIVLGEASQQALPGAAGEGLSALASLLGLGFAAWLSLRLSLNAAQTFDEARLNIWGSFDLTRDRFWSLFVGYATAFGLALVVMFLCMQIVDGALVLASGMTSAKGADGLDMSSLTALGQPSVILYLFLTGGVMSPLTASILMAAPIAAYRQIRALGKPAAAA
jgi:hypothetical protein